jgi:spermidine synthase
MTGRFEEVDWQATTIGEVSLRRRRDPALDVDVYEVKLGDEFLMSSLFTVAEEELARLGLAAVERDSLDVAVGGLGLGCTARAALADPRVTSLVVVDYLAAVVDWHERGLVPGSAELVADARTRLVRGDFFAMVAEGGGLDPEQPGRRFDAVLLDIDHTPRHVLHPSHQPFYTAEGLTRLRELLTEPGVFALWSDDPPDEDFGVVLDQVFSRWDAHVVTFDNPYGGEQKSNTVYVASR